MGIKKVEHHFSEKKVDYYFDAEFQYLEQIVSKENTILITDENVYGRQQAKFSGWKTIVIQPGEAFKQQAEEDKLQYQKTFIVAVSEVQQSIQNVNMYKEEWAARNKQVEAAKLNYQLSYARYDNGYVSYLEVLDVERALFEAQLDLAQLTERQLSSMVELYKALGGGWN